MANVEPKDNWKVHFRDTMKGGRFLKSVAHGAARRDGTVGPRFMIALAGLDVHPLDTLDRRELAKKEYGVGFCNITRCYTEVCPEHINITADDFFDPVRWALRKVTGGSKKEEGELADRSSHSECTNRRKFCGLDDGRKARQERARVSKSREGSCTTLN